MAEKRTKTRYFELSPTNFGFFSRFFVAKNELDFADAENLRKALSNEKARILYMLKNEKINSIYQLAKILKRDFKSVYEDLKFLEKLGFIEFIEEDKGKKRCLKPVLAVDKMELVIYI